jgi:hypothetical protein
MHVRAMRRITAFILAGLFAVSLGLHGLLAATASANMDAPASHSAMASGDEPMNCPGPDGADPASCYAICAAFIGIVFEPARLPVALSNKIHAGAAIVSLSDRSIPPDPYPPRPSALI